MGAMTLGTVGPWLVAGRRLTSQASLFLAALFLQDFLSPCQPFTESPLSTEEPPNLPLRQPSLRISIEPCVSDR